MRTPLSSQGLAPLEALRAPHVTTPVILAERARAGWQHYPWLLRLSIDVHVGWKQLRFIQCARHTRSLPGHQSQRSDSTARLTCRATRNALALTACAGSRHELDAATQHLHPVRLDERVERKDCASLALTPAAMTAMHDERRRSQAIAHRPAGAAAFAPARDGFAHVTCVLRSARARPHSPAARPANRAHRGESSRNCSGSSS